LARLAGLAAVLGSLLLSTSASAIPFHSAVPTGRITGKLTVTGGPVERGAYPDKVRAGSAVLVKIGSRLVSVLHVNGKGAFTVRLAPGTYALSGTVGGDCHPVEVVVKPHQTSHVSLLCSLR
jgi:hypothetical protein